MFLVYRKRKDLQTWHFNTHCSHWPEVDFVQVRVIDAKTNQGEGLCQECMRLETEMFPTQHPVALDVDLAHFYFKCGTYFTWR
jgi:hypothetical protein